MIKINEKEYPVKVSEMTLEQWTNVSNAIQVFKDDALLQFEAVLKALGVPEKECDTLPISFMNELYPQLEDVADDYELTETIDRYTLTLPDVFTVKEAKMIDRLAVEFGNHTVALLAFFYRDQSLTLTEHTDKAHIKHKMQLFKPMPAKDFVYAVGAIMEYLTKEIKSLQSEG